MYDCYSFKFVKICFMAQNVVYLGECCLGNLRGMYSAVVGWSRLLHPVDWWCCWIQLCPCWFSIFWICPFLIESCWNLQLWEWIHPFLFAVLLVVFVVCFCFFKYSWLTVCVNFILRIQEALIFQSFQLFFLGWRGNLQVSQMLVFFSI